MFALMRYYGCLLLFCPCITYFIVLQIMKNLIIRFYAMLHYMIIRYAIEF